MLFDGSDDFRQRKALIERVINDLDALSNHPQIRKYRIAIVGSWATKEPHLFLDSKKCATSYSDLDLVHRELIPESESSRLLNRFRCVANAAGIEKVSLRSIAEYETIPHGATWCSRAPTDAKVDASTFLTFWFFVSCTEAIVLQARAANTTSASYYSLAKTLYALLRNVAFILGDYPKSYRELSDSFGDLLNHALLAAAYRTKLGIFHSDCSLLEHFFAHEIGSFLNRLPFPISVTTVTLISESSTLLIRGALDSDSVLEAMVASTYSDRMHEVIAYQREKLKT